MISIIIPTLNEENYLPVLLESIKRTTRPGLVEIIVADADSEDKTVEVAKGYSCQIVKGGLPARGRNEGAKIAQGNLLLFLDADTILPENFFEKILEEFKGRKLDIASFCLDSPSKRRTQKFLFDIFYNWPVLIFERILSHGSQAILVKKEIFDRVGGFDEKIKFAEDHNFVRKAKRVGNFGILKSVKILSSLRRFKKDGWAKTYFKYILAELYMIFSGDIKEEIFQYKFGHYNK